MSRMGEWFMEWHEDDDIDLMLAELAHEEELEQQRQLEEQKCPSLPGLITPPSIQLPNSPPMSSSTHGQVTVMTSTGSWLPKSS
jgi:hypothetical protein